MCVYVVLQVHLYGHIKMIDEHVKPTLLDGMLVYINLTCIMIICIYSS